MPQRDIGDGLAVFAGQRAAARVVGRVNDEQLGPVGDQAIQFIGVDAEVVVLAQRDRDGHRPGERGDGLVHREARVRVEDLVALVGQGEDGEEHDRLGARGDHHAVGRGAQPAGALEEGGHGLAQRGDAGRGHVVGVPGPQRL